jgi:hypothetical protein
MNRFLVCSFVAIPLAVSLMAGCSTYESEGEPKVTDPSQLAAPLQGEGFQFKTELLAVAPGKEVQNCYFYRVGDLAKKGGLPENEAVNLHRVRIVQREGSHHMNIFRVKTIKGLDPAKGTVLGENGAGECFKSPNWSDWPLIANTQQTGDLDWTYPDGVVNKLQPDEWIMLQSHFVNASSQKSPEGAEVAVNFHTLKPADAKQEMGTLFATKQSIRVCRSNPSPTFTGSCQFKSQQPVTIIGANGHFHARGKQFDMFNWDGKSIATPPDTERFYQSRTWDEPPMLRSPDLNVAVQPGGGVMYTCGFQWTPPAAEAGGCEALDAYDIAKHPDAKPDCCYTFGPIVERNEHCNAFVYYYPKQDDVFCN